MDHPDPVGGRVQIQEYDASRRGLVAKPGAGNPGAEGIVSHDGEKRFVSRAEARRLVELGTAMYCKDLHGKIIKE